MPGDPLLYKILVLGTLLVGLMSLLGNLFPRIRRRRGSHVAWGAIREPLAHIVALFADESLGLTPRVRKAQAGAERTESARQTDQQWQARLTPEQYDVTRRGLTERPFTGAYWDLYEDGVYHCVGCGQELFASDSKFESGTGWPSFSQPVRPEVVSDLQNISYGIVRTEVVCSQCEAHLGHLFGDGPEPSGQRYCINSAALEFVPEQHVAVN